MRKKIPIPILAAALALAAGGAVRSVCAAYNDLGVSARATGMGNAFTAVADDAYAVYYNPSGLATLTRPEVGATYSQILGGLSDGSSLQNSFFTYAQPIEGGSQGTFGAALNYFSLDSLYYETSLYASYGRRAFEDSLPGKLYLGGSLEYLQRGFGNLGSEVNSPINDQGQVVPGTADSVLQSGSKGNVDAGIGFLYRPRPHWSLGGDIDHLLEPNIAMGPGASDPLNRDYKFGGAWRSAFTTVAAEFDIVPTPDSSMESVGTLAGEKWLPTLAHGTFGLRGALSSGTEGDRTISAGLSYKIYRLEIDYGFVMPVSGLNFSDTYGTHRLGLTLRFGQPPLSRELYGEALLENLGEVARLGTPEFKVQRSELSRFRAVAVQSFIDQAKRYVEKAKFAQAAERMAQAAALNPRNSKLAATMRRLESVSKYYPDLPDFQNNAAKATIYMALLRYINGSVEEALMYFQSAIALAPNDKALQALSSGLASQVGAPTPAAPTQAPPAPPSASPDVGAPRASAAARPAMAAQGYLSLAQIALGLREYDKVVSLARKAIAMEPSNSDAYLTLGRACYGLKQYTKALKALRSALRHASGSQPRSDIRSMISAVQERLGAAKQAAIRQVPEFVYPREIEDLYQAGIEFYAQGRLREAAEAFRKLLRISPDNIPARKALRRVDAEILESGVSR